MYTALVVDNTTTNLTQTTIYIPETVSSFVSVTADLGFADVTTAAGAIGNKSLNLRLGASAYTSVANASTLLATGENIGGVFGPFDFTSLFTASWTGTSMTTDAQVLFDQTTGTILGMRNVTVTLDITYQYDDTAATQIKTVMLPFESLAADLPTVANTNFGTNQIPILTGGSGVLPENGVTIRDYYFLVEGNDYITSATDLTLSANIDSGTAMVSGLIESALLTLRYGRFIFKPAAVPTTTLAHNFQLWTNLASRFNSVTVTLVITYQFTLASTTRVLNSILLPYGGSSPLGVTTSASASRYAETLHILEPGTITMRQSAFRINYYTASGPSGLNFRAGAQAFRAYTSTGGVAIAGPYSLQQRIDSGSVQGAGATLTRGANAVVIEGYSTNNTDATHPTAINGYIIINYESDLSASGIGAHSHTVKKAIRYFNLSPTALTPTSTFLPSVPEANYYLINAGFILYLFSTITTQTISLQAQCLSTEGKGGGYYDAFIDSYYTNTELGLSNMWLPSGKLMRRWPLDNSIDRIEFKGSRIYRMYTSSTTSWALAMIYTYHSITFSVSGTISGSAGGTVNINVYRSDTQELIYTTTRVGNGAYSFTWYDNTAAIYAEAYEDTTHYGRSINVTAGVTNPDISLSTGGGSVQVVARAYA